MNDSPLLPPKLCEEILQATMAAARRAGVEHVEIMLGAGEESLTRFANNQIHQNVSERSHFLSIRTLDGQRTSRATTNRVERNGIEAAVDQAIVLMRSSEPDPALLPLLGGTGNADGRRYSAEVAESTPAARAHAVAEAIRLVEGEGQTAAGIYSTANSAEAILNSAGLSRYYDETKSVFSITAMDTGSSGWAKASSPHYDPAMPMKLAASAARKAKLSRNPREISPGEYTVILEPAAVLDLAGQIFADFSGTALSDQRSFLTDRLGTSLFGENISICDDVNHPLQTGAPFDGEGVLRKKLTLVERGVPSDVAYSRASATAAGKEPTGHGFPLPNEGGESPVNIVIAGGSTSVEEMIVSTKRGILVTRLWYIREVEPYEKVMTGMTRDGTFLIEDGEVVCGIRNLRFNQSVVELLKNVAALSPSARTSGEEAFDMVVPAMKVEAFRFTEVTKF
jgi:predicted Zn-dependent protease